MSKLTRHKYIGEGSYGIVVSDSKEPDIAIKLFENEQTFNDEFSGYETARELINKEIPEYSHYFVKYLGDKEQTFCEDMYHRVLHFEKYDNTVLKLVQNESISIEVIKMVLDEYIKMFKLFKTMIEKKIGHFDVNPSNILYRLNPEKSEVKLALCDYSSINYTKYYDYNGLYGYYFAYTPALYWNICVINDTIKHFNLNKYDISRYYSKIVSEIEHNLDEVNNSLNVFHSVTKDFTFNKEIIYEKYFCDVKDTNMDIKKYSSSLRSQIINHYDGLDPTIEEYVADIVKYNDLYGFAFSLLLILKRVKRLDKKIEKTIYDMMTTTNYFSKDINSYDKDLDELKTRLNTPEPVVITAEEIPKSSCVVM